MNLLKRLGLFFKEIKSLFKQTVMQNNKTTNPIESAIEQRLIRSEQIAQLTEATKYKVDVCPETFTPPNIGIHTGIFSNAYVLADGHLNKGICYEVIPDEELPISEGGVRAYAIDERLGKLTRYPEWAKQLEAAAAERKENYILDLNSLSKADLEKLNSIDDPVARHRFLESIRQKKATLLKYVYNKVDSALFNYKAHSAEDIKNLLMSNDLVLINLLSKRRKVTMNLPEDFDVGTFVVSDLMDEWSRFSAERLMI